MLRERPAVNTIDRSIPSSRIISTSDAGAHDRLRNSGETSESFSAALIDVTWGQHRQDGARDLVRPLRLKEVPSSVENERLPVGRFGGK
jgi:hypothetical protein